MGKPSVQRSSGPPPFRGISRTSSTCPVIDRVLCSTPAMSKKNTLMCDDTRPFTPLGGGIRSPAITIQPVGVDAIPRFPTGVS